MAVININRNQFEEMVHSGKTVLVEFSAPWCVYCRRLAPALESVAEEYKDTLVFTAVNIDDEPELAEAEAIEVVPTLLIYHSGQALALSSLRNPGRSWWRSLKKLYSTRRRKQLLCSIFTT